MLEFLLFLILLSILACKGHLDRSADSLRGIRKQIERIGDQSEGIDDE